VNYYVNTEYLDSISQLYSGLAMIPNEALTSSPEIDFLDMHRKK